MAKREIICLPDHKLAAKRDFDVKRLDDAIVIPEAVLTYGKNKHYLLKTFGCQANYRDEEIIAGILEMCGMSKTDDESDADIIILNTCAVRENAEQKVYGKIGTLKALKQKNKKLIIGVCGCMIEEPHVVNYIIEKFPFVNLLFGTHNIDKLADMINEIVTKNVRLIDVRSYCDYTRENLPSKRKSTFQAFVNITYGCDNFCTYCIVPYTRGKERSRLVEDVLNECKELKKEGYLEVTLLGENVNSYGKDLKEPKTFAELLEKVALLGFPRVRFLTSHPADFTSDLIDVIARHDNIMKYIHLPVQSGNDEVLRRMNRRYDSKRYYQIIDELKAKIPNLSLSTDIIVGFPNETEEQFLDTLKLVERVEYDSAFTFIFSPRVGTPAENMVDNVTRKEKGDRFKRLTSTLEKIITRKSLEMVGKVYDVLVEGPSEKDPELLSGYTEGNKLVHFKGCKHLIGKIVPVKIIESHVYSLIGELLSDLDAAIFHAKKELMNEEIVKKYFLLKDEIEKSQDLQKLFNEKKLLEEKIKNNDENLEKMRKSLLICEKNISENPLFSNFKVVKEEVIRLLEQVQSMLEE